ncbi:unnamed protein product [Arabis nemorensis]|uniref:Uncharacterized protein n=1 Tax=Arabis nemorensis TaxID=586526 RepID=A0A565BTT9_9BRAS|nr:unnamed protein product [Arabis nemorensis]
MHFARKAYFGSRVNVASSSLSVVVDFDLHRPREVGDSVAETLKPSKFQRIPILDLGNQSLSVRSG